MGPQDPVACWMWPALRSRQGHSALSACLISGTSSVNLSGEKGLGLFLSREQEALFQLEWDQLVWVMCDPSSHTTCDTETGHT